MGRRVSSQIRTCARRLCHTKKNSQNFGSVVQQISSFSCCLGNRKSARSGFPGVLSLPIFEVMHHHYEKIAVAINFIRENFRQQPSLDEVAAQVNLSPFHFQRIFTEWAGISPKQYL